MHLIHKHIFDIDVERKEFASQIHNMLGDVLQTSFYPKLDMLLNKYSLTNETISFNRIVFNLQPISAKNWQDQLVNSMLLQMESFLQEHISTSKAKATKQTLAKSTTHIALREELLITFLKTGHIPLNPLASNLQEVEEDLVISAEWIKQLRLIFIEEDKHWKRFFFNLSESFLQRVLSYVQEHEKALASPIKDVVLVLQKSAHVGNRVILAIQLFLYFFQHEKNNTALWAKTFLAMLKEEGRLILDNKFYEQVQIRLNERKNSLAQVTPSSFPLLFHILEALTKTSAVTSIMEDVKEIKLKNGITINQQEDTKEAIRKTTKEETEYYIEHAGLILLHPFLQPLFKNLSYLNEDGWIAEEYLQQATCIMQYAVTGEELFLENELLLHKILCGLEPSSLITTHIKLSSEEKDMMNDLLVSLISHWKILKNTSVESLRNTFLKRNGKLIYKHDRYELHVENNAVDILLEQLPWGISYIQLPWMTKPLHVNWQTN